MYPDASLHAPTRSREPSLICESLLRTAGASGSKSFKRFVLAARTKRRCRWLRCSRIKHKISPLRLPDHPISCAVLASWPGNASLNLRGTHSSSSSRTRFAHILAQFERSHGLLACHGREIIQKFIEGISGFQIVIKRLDRNARAYEDGHATQYFRIGVHDFSDVYHRSHDTPHRLSAFVQAGEDELAMT